MGDAAGSRRARVLISGRVQGVFFRHETSKVAGGFRLGGWVRNLPDGRVEAVFEGPAPLVEAAVSWCRHGPALARVEGVEVIEEQPSGDAVFRIR